jgi:hypothetical protein
MGMDPYEADPAAYESAISAAGLAIRACWAKRPITQWPRGLRRVSTIDDL